MPGPIAPHAGTAPNGIKDIHPAALDAVVAWNNVHKERDQLEATLQRTRNDLEVANRHIQELQYQLDQVTERRDYFQRYSVQASTDLQHIVTAAHNIISAAQTARDRSLEAAQLSEPAEEPSPVDDVERQLAEMTKQLNGGEPMPAAVTQRPRGDHG
jgi:chromosome segregation ATPase